MWLVKSSSFPKPQPCSLSPGAPGGPDFQWEWGRCGAGKTNSRKISSLPNPRDLGSENFGTQGPQQVMSTWFMKAQPHLF